MHIPDNFLSTPVWLTLDAVSVPVVGWMARKARADVEEARIPLLGVMGAFVFAAQMINFPVGVGTSGHLVGGALLACTLGPSAASLVLTAIIATQAFIFQDGGVLALGANVLNMAVAGVLAAWLPIRLWGSGPVRNAAIFCGGFFSVMVSALLALAELLISGVHMPRQVIVLSLVFFAVNALLEGVITASVVQAIERINPGWVRNPGPARRPALAALAGAAVFLVVAGFVFASTAPDGIQRLALRLGIPSQPVFRSPLAGYGLPSLETSWPGRAAAGLAGLGLVCFVCFILGRAISRRRSA